MQRHGLYGFWGKLIATIGYFVFVITFGMGTAYEKLDLAPNELAFHYIDKKNELPIGGIIEELASKSPKYCDQIFRLLDNECICRKYSDNLYFL